jgi:hypothetical protein
MIVPFTGLEQRQVRAKCRTRAMLPRVIQPPSTFLTGGAKETAGTGLRVSVSLAGQSNRIYVEALHHLVQALRLSFNALKHRPIHVALPM